MTEATTPEAAGEKPAEYTTARFTAVNGSGEAAAISNGTNGTNGNTPQRKSPEDRANGQQRVSFPYQHRRTPLTELQREDWTQPSANGDHASNSAAQHPDPHSESEKSHKRKRSSSINGHSSNGTGLPNTSNFHSHGLPRSPTKEPGPVEAVDPTRDPSVRTGAYSESREYYDAQPQPYSAMQEDRRESSWSTQTAQDSRYEPSQTPQQLHSTDDRLMTEALTREIQRDPHQPHLHNGYATTNPGEDDRNGIQYQGGYVHDQNGVQVQSDLKKRKRNFSNRTKTGCMTCRKRKKKCDEGRPDCKDLAAKISVISFS
jgi:hypothetical protein